jgi:hypothetical protein
VRRTLWSESSGYDTSFRDWEDWDFWLGAAARGWQFVKLARPSFEYRIRPGSLHQRFLKGSEVEATRKRFYEKHRALLASHAPDVLLYAHDERRRLFEDAAALRASRDAIQGEIDRLAAGTRELLAARDEELVSLRSTLAAKNEEVAALRSALDARDAELAETIAAQGAEMIESPEGSFEADAMAVEALLGSPRADLSSPRKGLVTPLRRLVLRLIRVYWVQQLAVDRALLTAMRTLRRESRNELNALSNEVRELRKGRDE